MAQFNQKQIESFWTGVQKTEKCWNWMKSGVGGYGRVKRNGISILAHRFSWMITNGEIPRGLCVLHQCDNRKCVNPEHLFLGTYKDNANDAREKGRKWYGENAGEGNGRSKLTDYAVNFIRNSNVRAKILAQIFGVDVTQIYAVRAGRSWTHI